MPPHWLEQINATLVKLVEYMLTNPVRGLLACEFILDGQPILHGVHLACGRDLALRCGLENFDCGRADNSMDALPEYMI